MTPTDQRLREIAERENKATKGPWKDHGIPHPVAVQTLKEAAGVSSDSCLIYSQPRDYGCLPETFNRQLGDAQFIAHSRQDVPWLLSLIKKQREALEHIATCGEFQCNQLCAKDYIPRGRHAPDCPIEYFATARDALNFSPENL